MLPNRNKTGLLCWFMWSAFWDNLRSSNIQITWLVTGKFTINSKKRQSFKFLITHSYWANFPDRSQERMVSLLAYQKCNLRIQYSSKLLLDLVKSSAYGDSRNYTYCNPNTGLLSLFGCRVYLCSKSKSC